MKNTNKPFRYCAAVLLSCMSLLPLQAQKNVILDTDMGPDCDDAGALAMLHAMADKGEANILAVGSCISDPNSAATIDAINTYYGRPNIPVGTLKDVGFLPGPYGWIAAVKDFPNDLKSGANAPDVVKLYRQTLAAQPDNSVTLISIGPLRNIRNLLQSDADSYSNLNGIDLVSKKVSKYVLMGGWFTSGSEYNMNQDGVSAEYVTNNFPSNIEMVFSQMHIGSTVNTGARLNETPPTNPVRKAYEIYSGIGKHNASWDQTAILYAIRGLGVHWILETNGYCNVNSAGYTEWKSSPDKNQSYLKWISQAQSMTTVKELAIIIEDLMVAAPLLNSVIAFPVTGISLNTSKSSLAVSASLSLVASISPSNATNNSVIWTSSNPAVAKVSLAGIVTSVGPGTATITATTANGSKKATCEITTTVLGSVVAEYWTGIPGTAIPETMPTSKPDQTKDLYSLDVPMGFADEYLLRMKGYIIPTTSGIYNLYISSDDTGELWLSTNADAKNIVKIARVDDHTGELQWNKSPNQKSASTTLSAGTKYYFEAIMKEGGGGDHLTVGWTGPGITSVAVIGGANIDKHIGVPK